jgi:hypothetical protein
LEREAAEKPFPDERLVTREANGKTVLELLTNASTMPESSKLIWKEKRRKNHFPMSASSRVKRMGKRFWSRWPMHPPCLSLVN